MKTCIFIGTRYEALKTVEKFYKIILIITERNSHIDRFYKKKIKKIFIKRQNKTKIFKILSKKKVELLFSAGFPFILPAYSFKKKKLLLNSHPSLLPKYKGLKPIDEMFKNKNKYYGVTIHEINKNVDSGKIIEKVRYNFKTKNLKKIKNYIFSKLEPKLIYKVLSKINNEQ